VDLGDPDHLAMVPPFHVQQGGRRSSRSSTFGRRKSLHILETDSLGNHKPSMYLRTKRLCCSRESGAAAGCGQIDQLGRSQRSQILSKVLASNRSYASNFGDQTKLALPPARRFAILRKVFCHSQSCSSRLRSLGRESLRPLHADRACRN
jgi:hypothetical protein